VLEIKYWQKLETTIFVLDWEEPKDFMIINTRNKSYDSKGEYDPPHTSSSPSSSSQDAIVHDTKTSDSQGVSSPLPSSKYKILNQLDNIKANATLLDMVFVPEKQKNLKNFMEGKSSTIANIFEEAKEKDYIVNKVGLNHFRHLVKKPQFFISAKIMDKIAHCSLIDGSSGPSVMSKIIMEELGLSCTNGNSRSMPSYNSLKQSNIDEIKYLTLVQCAHRKIRTTLNIQVIDMPVSNY
jgi:hypothetical protein